MVVVFPIQNILPKPDLDQEIVALLIKINHELSGDGDGFHKALLSIYTANDT